MTLPDTGRVWVFGSTTSLDPEAEQHLLATVDDYLAHWKAHGSPLTVGRDWREHRFLTVAVDTSASTASGCSIDGLFRVLQQMEVQLGVSLVSGGRVYYRNAEGKVVCVDRADFASLAERGDITADVMVFDTTVTTLGDWRTRFEVPAGLTWHGTLI